MKEFRKKQKKLKNIMNFAVIFGAVFFVVYIGASTYIAAASAVAARICSYFFDLLVIAILVIVFLYYSKYGKSDSFLNYVEHEISDAGYYITSKEETDVNSYINSMYEDLKNCSFSVNKNINCGDFDFAVRAFKRKEFFYIADIEDVNRNDVLAYLDTLINDLTVKNLKRKGNAVLCIVTDNAQAGAVALSKMITPLGRKEQLKIAICIVEVNSRRVYFLGNLESKCKQLIANFAMNCEIPIKEQYIGKESLLFQAELEEKMKSFNIKDFKNGNFFAH